MVIGGKIMNQSETTPAKVVKIATTLVDPAALYADYEVDCLYTMVQRLSAAVPRYWYTLCCIRVRVSAYPPKGSCGHVT